MALSMDDLREIRASVGNKCERCGIAEFTRSNGASSLHVHHKIERHKKGGTDERVNLEVLCAACHRREHVKRQGPLPAHQRRSRKVVVGFTEEEYILLLRVREAMRTPDLTNVLRKGLEQLAQRLQKKGELPRRDELEAERCSTYLEQNLRRADEVPA